jgi:hypothetical protein
MQDDFPTADRRVYLTAAVFRASLSVFVIPAEFTRVYGRDPGMQSIINNLYDNDALTLTMTKERTEKWS